MNRRKPTYDSLKYVRRLGAAAGWAVVLGSHGASSPTAGSHMSRQGPGPHTDHHGQPSRHIDLLVDSTTLKMLAGGCVLGPTRPPPNGHVRGSMAVDGHYSHRQASYPGINEAAVRHRHLTTRTVGRSMSIVVKDMAIRVWSRR